MITKWYTWGTEMVQSRQSRRNYSHFCAHLSGRELTHFTGYICWVFHIKFHHLWNHLLDTYSLPHKSSLTGNSITIFVAGRRVQNGWYKWHVHCLGKAGNCPCACLWP